MSPPNSLISTTTCHGAGYARALEETEKREDKKKNHKVNANYSITQTIPFVAASKTLMTLILRACNRVVSVVHAGIQMSQLTLFTLRRYAGLVIFIVFGV